MNHRVERLKKDLVNGSILRNIVYTLAPPRFQLLTSHTNVILSVLEAVLGSNFARPIYAKARAPKTPAMENAEVVVNIGVAVALVMGDSSTWSLRMVDMR